MGRQFEDSGGGGGAGGGGGTTAQSARELVSGESKRTNFDFPLFLIFKPFISVSLSVYVGNFRVFSERGGERKSEHFPTPLSHTTIIIIFSFSSFSLKKKVR